jgi:hypothetical protein
MGNPKRASNNSISINQDKHKDYILTQYQIISDRRINQNEMLWQTPTLCFTAQAFLFTIALGNGIPIEARLISAFLIVVTSILCLQLMSKHRYFEVENSKLLEKIEKENGFLVIHAKSNTTTEKLNFFTKLTSYKIWMIGMVIFLFIAILLTIYCLYRMLLIYGVFKMIFLHMPG